MFVNLALTRGVKSIATNLDWSNELSVVKKQRLQKKRSFINKLENDWNVEQKRWMWIVNIEMAFSRSRFAVFGMKERYSDS